MSSNYPQPIKLFSFYSKKDKNGNNCYIFGDQLFPHFDNHSTIINPPLDVMAGIDEYLKKPYSSMNECHWDVMAYMKKKIGMSLQQITDHSDVVCYRGFLKDLALIPLGENTNNAYVAFMFDGIVFIERIDNCIYPISSNDIKKEYMKKKLFKFCTIPYNKKNPDINSPIDFEERYYVVKTRTFEIEDCKIKVMFTGDVDAIDPNNKSKGNNYMKIKVCPGHIMHLFKNSGLHKTWAQSFIAGNEVIGAGIRKKTLIKEVKYFYVSELEAQLPIKVSKIMEFVGKCLKNIVNACKKYPNKYIMIPKEKNYLFVEEEEIMRNINFSRPTEAFIEAFPVKQSNN